ncbi:hypothetical protein KRR26_12340 [Corallococcus sp. M34]|uniref:hypothetical protein n=1 Tax=Citreicoccus inhibens TaxID=2849499 RepID=UPI001C21F64D|nr:hypothetical protein [Citreicoccus inhibens]MBU8896402.1 hypothetical protein [Citreicoccus inhibens]
MSPAVPLPFVLLASALLLTALVFLTLWQRQRMRRSAWESFAKAHGLSCTPTRLEVQGRYQGRQLLLATARRTHARRRKDTVTVLRLDLEGALPPELLLEHEHPEDKAPGVPATRDEVLGDTELDAAFVVENLAPEARPVLADARVRERLLGLRGYRRASVKGGWLQVEQRGVPTNLQAVEALVRNPHELAQAVVEAAHHAAQAVHELEPVREEVREHA